MENLDFRETLEVLSEKANIDIKRFEVHTGKYSSKDNTDEKEKILNINKETAKYFYEALVKEYRLNLSTIL
jgi:DNA primase